jgi:hypothetical protein
LKIPPLDSFAPRRSALRAKTAELHVENAQDIAQCAIIRQRMAEAPDPGNEYQRRVAEILGEKPIAGKLADADQLLALQNKIEARKAAIAILDAEFQKETRLAANAVLEAVRPEVTRLGNNFAKAFLALRQEHLEYVEFIDKLDDAGGNVSAIRITPNGLSDPRDRSSNYAYGLREFAEAGFISKSVAPKVI